MRLLEYNNDGELSLTEDFVGGEIPEYAILSHYLLQKPKDMQPKITAKTPLHETTAKKSPVKIVTEINATSKNRVVDYIVECPDFTREPSSAFAQELMKILDARFLVGDISVFLDEFAIEFQTLNSRRDNLALGQEDLVFEINLDKNLKFTKVEERE
ncbi:hypothetical protein ACEPPN_000341 [Leptodophora sp. 'Broadleaf-Isolate-01']